MRRLNALFILVLVGTLFTSCSSEEDYLIDLGNPPKGYHFTDSFGNTVSSIVDGGSVNIRNEAGEVLVEFNVGTPGSVIDLSDAVIERDENRLFFYVGNKQNDGGNIIFHLPCSIEDKTVLICRSANSLEDIHSQCADPILAKPSYKNIRDLIKGYASATLPTTPEEGCQVFIKTFDRLGDRVGIMGTSVESLDLPLY